MKKYICIAVILSITACGVFEGTKEVGKDLADDVNVGNPLTEASRKEALSDAREQVVITRKIYNKCLEEHNDNESACTEEKAMYEKSTERYMQLQKN